jgi:Right handed beta helix region
MSRHTLMDLLTVVVIVMLMWTALSLAADERAALTITDASSAQALQGQTIRCDAATPLGVRVTAARAVVRDVTIDGCETGIVVDTNAVQTTIANVFFTNPGPRVPDASTQAVETTSGNVFLTSGSVGVWIRGGSGMFEQNTILGYDIGILLDGNNFVFRNNLVTDGVLDGILLLGQDNVIEGNIIERYRGVGIYAAGSYPVRIDFGDLRELGLRKKVPLRNIIRFNRLRNNGLDLADQTEPCDPQFGLRNTWQGNVFATKFPECLQ